MRTTKDDELKIWPEYYKAIIDKVKKFEIRKNDRNFKVGDRLILREFKPCEECNGSGGTYDLVPRNGEIIGIPCDCKKPHGKYTGNSCSVSIDYILDDEKFGIEKGYCVMSISVIRENSTEY